MNNYSSLKCQLRRGHSINQYKPPERCKMTMMLFIFHFLPIRLYVHTQPYKYSSHTILFFLCLLLFSVPLASQQAKVIDKHTDLKVKHYVGEMGVDFWDKDIWEKEFNDNNVLVMTAQIFLDLLNHGYIRLSQVNLLIFDECHHAKKNDPYRQIMQRFGDCKRDEYPKIMGLTASVVNKKVKFLTDVVTGIEELERTLRSTCETSQDEEVEKFAAKPMEVVMTFSNNSIDEESSILIQILQEVLSPALEFLQDCRVPRDETLVWNAHWYAKFALRECYETLSELGPWAANRVAGYLIMDLGMVCVNILLVSNCHFGSRRGAGTSI